MEKNGLPVAEKTAAAQDKTKQAKPAFKTTESDKLFDEALKSQKPVVKEAKVNE